MKSQRYLAILLLVLWLLVLAACAKATPTPAPATEPEVKYDASMLQVFAALPAEAAPAGYTITD